MKKCIIIVYPYRFRIFDQIRLEVDCLKKQSKVIIHELLDCLHPHFSGAYHTTHTSSDIKKFSSLLKWRSEYLSIVESCEEKPYIINFVAIDSFSSLFVNYVVSNSDVFLIKYKNPGLPAVSDDCSFFEKIVLKLTLIYKRGTLKSLNYQIISKICQIFSYFFCRQNDYILKVGKVVDSYGSSKIFKANSFDYSMFLNFKHAKKPDCYKNTIVFLDSGAPLFQTDSLLSGRKVELTVDKWYPSLVNFFDWIEEKTGYTVVIAAHPKHQYNNETEKIFCGRRVFHNRTIDLVSQSKLILTVGSTAVSHAVMLNKSIILLNSNEIICGNNVTLKHIEYLNKLLGCQIINVDSYNKDSVVFKKIDKSKYLSYKNNYLSSRNDGKTNCEIIVDEIINHE